MCTASTYLCSKPSYLNILSHSSHSNFCQAQLQLQFQVQLELRIALILLKSSHWASRDKLQLQLQIQLQTQLNLTWAWHSLCIFFHSEIFFYWPTDNSITNIWDYCSSFHEAWKIQHFCSTFSFYDLCSNCLQWLTRSRGLYTVSCVVFTYICVSRLSRLLLQKAQTVHVLVTIVTCKHHTCVFWRRISLHVKYYLFIVGGTGGSNVTPCFNGCVFYLMPHYDNGTNQFLAKF